MKQKAMFEAGKNWFEFRGFFLLDWLQTKTK